jgi:hypothetical protein
VKTDFKIGDIVKIMTSNTTFMFGEFKGYCWYQEGIRVKFADCEFEDECPINFVVNHYVLQGTK